MCCDFMVTRRVRGNFAMKKKPKNFVFSFRDLLSKLK